MAVRGDVADPERYEIATPELAIDGQVEKGEIAHSALEVQLRSDCPDVLGLQRRLRPDQLALVPRVPPCGVSYRILHFFSLLA
jgi:hypothetical protein